MIRAYILVFAVSLLCIQLTYASSTVESKLSNQPKNTKKPIIGITIDSQNSGGYSSSPWYAIRQNYSEVISAAGGVPIIIPYDFDAINQYVDLLDGLLITGKTSVPPRLYGEEKVHKTTIINEQRTKFEWEITKAMLARNKPILGICGGMQLLNVILGGTLFQHIPDDIPNFLNHQKISEDKKSEHQVSIIPETLLSQITKVSIRTANSSHHQAINKIPPAIVINAIAPDGVIEGIECPKYKFCLGVQWHPEYRETSFDIKIIEALVKATQ